MARILLTGMSGTGKTTVLNELRRRGREVVDTEYDGWVRGADGWDVRRMDQLLTTTDVVVAGCVGNQGQFYDRFDHVVLLSVPAEVILQRVEHRRTNPYGRSAEDRAEILGHLQTVEPRLRATATLELDGRQPVAVLDSVIEQLS